MESQREIDKRECVCGERKKRKRGKGERKEFGIDS